MKMFKSSEVKKGIERIGSFIKENEERITGISVMSRGPSDLMGSTARFMLQFKTIMVSTTLGSITLRTNAVDFLCLEGISKIVDCGTTNDGSRKFTVICGFKGSSQWYSLDIHLYCSGQTKAES